MTHPCRYLAILFLALMVPAKAFPNPTPMPSLMDAEIRVQPWEPPLVLGAVAFRSSHTPAEGASWGATAVAGLAEFVAERANAELAQWFMLDVAENLCGDLELDNNSSQGKSQRIFQNTCNLHLKFSSSTFLTPYMLISAMRRDIETLPAAVISVSHNNQKWPYVMLSLLDRIRTGEKPLNLIAGLAENNTLETECKNSNIEEACSAIIAGIVAQAYLATSDLTAFRLRMSSVSAHNSSIIPTRFKAAFDQLNSTRSRVERFAKSFKSRAKDIESEIKHLETLKKDRADAREILAAAFRIALMSGDLVEYAYQLDPDETKIELPNSVLRIGAHAMSGDYSGALIELVSLIKSQTEDDDKLRKILNEDLLLIIELSKASSSGDVKNILNSVASPVGAWRMKRKKAMVSLGALAGAHVGHERLQGGGGTHESLVLGLFAPVGIDFSWRAEWFPLGIPFIRIPGNGHTRGIFFSLIDIGNLVGARLDGSANGNVTSVDVDPNIGVAQVISPGVYYRAGIGKSPFVWGFGASYNPALRKANLAGGSSVNKDSLRLAVFLAIDIVMFPF